MTIQLRTARAWRRATTVLVAAGALGLPVRAGSTADRSAPQASTRQPSSVVSTAPIAPVEGPSTLHHLGLTIEQSSMGWAGQWSGAPSTIASDTEPGPRSEPPGGPFVLTGADLYRVSCRACHKPDGTGAPPEIHSLIGPVQATSARWMADGMRARGRPVDAAFIRELTTANEADLRKRLRQGGHNMPAFGQITDQEYAVLRPYLDELAGIPNVKTAGTIKEPADRVGELIVMGTCHICHDATEATSRPTTVLSGAIPALASLTHTKTFGDFVKKVREGAPVPLSSGGVSSRGRMPVFVYFTPPEVAAAYSYLMTYPPR